MSDPAQAAVLRQELPLIDVLVVSGLSAVETDPWQAWLQARFPQAGWVRPLDGDWPDLDRWSLRIDQALARGVTGRPALVLAHGFGALAVIRHAAQGLHAPASAILVTPASPHRFGLDRAGIGHPVPYKATLLAPQGGAHAESPWLQDEDAQSWAAAWNCRLVDAGRGPIQGVAAVAGATPPWPEGEAVLIEHMGPLLACARAARHASPIRGPYDRRMSADESQWLEHVTLMRDWVCGWAAARELAAPVAEGESWRVEVGWPQQVRRHVFARPGEALRALADTIAEPWVFLKCCVAADTLRALLPPHWTVQAPASMMVFDGPPPPPAPLPPGYVLELVAASALPHARILAPDGAMVADGRLVLVGDQAIFDRIATHADHRRRGLARAVMCALHGLAHERGATRGLLSATVAGEPLYESLGWRIHAPYASAVILSPSPTCRTAGTAASTSACSRPGRAS